ncbi:3-isopropylmalate dehydratase large subunit [Candidatus Karelsulcia muelleri]|uniref:3-isopropylmalate dehydratase n=1 Tax=Candidatus Karelsulcia muelleri TaxID=336810 RepID=A0A346E143_9FLAO|nr:3-isopropylmalate dehydratase large subunit [Candidatus Karelsulcia muelleri]AXN02698.1 3-isopropylmalate dehydratase large subunit [Candidatus Karelsulcia muelleri]WDI79490.1 3-isopropylmalate dehydratase large subunit [Candidatus Karelsulcia muelleri]WDR78948.1 3-isopropylmalate dehydratase large subunit [Candidatus Karelsulcia muelleri]
MALTIFDKIWNSHIIDTINKKIDIIYLDKQFIHEVTSPQAFETLEKRKIKIFRPEKIIATADHNVPTKNQHLPIKNALSRLQINLLRKNCIKNGIKFFGLGHKYQGIVHVIGPELGITLPGMTLVCGDSHTSTHGALGCIAFGIGTSQVAMVMASQCLLLKKPKKMRILIKGKLKLGVTPKDIILYIISKLGTGGATGYFVEYSGTVIDEMKMDGRMTICNMSIEMGARGGIIAPDKTTYNYIKDRAFSPKREKFIAAKLFWKTLKTDKNAHFDKEYEFDVSKIEPMITYGTSPNMCIKIDDCIPKKSENYFNKSLKYMGFQPGEYLLGKTINYVFIGSCTNSRLDDLRLVSKIVKGKKVAKNVHAMIVPGSTQVFRQLIKEKIDITLKESGFDLRQPGCSACLGMNEDKIPYGEYCVSTSNRNFEGRQGKGARTLLTSPLVAAITALKGKLVSIKKYLKKYGEI